MNFIVFVEFFLIILFPIVRSQDNRDYKSFLDKRADPCDDFYQYACGKWTPSNSQATDALSDQKLENFNALKNHFSVLQRRRLKQDPASQFYHQCLQSKFQTNIENLEPYLSKLVEISDWPLVNNTFSPSSFDWLFVSAKLRRYEVNTLFQLNIQRSWKNSGEYILYLSRSKAASPWDEASSFMYETYVKYILLDFGVRIRKAKTLAREVLDFEVELDKVSSDTEDSLPEPITLDELAAELPDIDWQHYFQTLLGKSPRPSQKIVVEIGFFKKLTALLSKTKTETIALAQMTKFLRHFGVRMEHPDWKGCIEEVNRRMPLLASKNLLSLRESSFSASKVRNIFEAIREELRQAINATSWYDITSKQELLTKLAAVQLRIGYLEPDFRSIPEIQIDPESYQRSRMLLSQSSVNNELALLSSRSVAGSGKQIEPLNVNAYYHLTTNSLDIPIGILQVPIYREHGTWAQIMGSLGAILGHELVHGFDYDGQSYDANGNVRSDISPKPLIQFGVRVKCYIDQYGNRVSSAVNEDIADNEGLHLAYRALGKFADQQTHGRREITDDQMFFISFAQIWCRSEEPTRRFTLHSSNKDRVNNVLANSQKFAEAFACRSGAQMNPVKKCRIW